MNRIIVWIAGIGLLFALNTSVMAFPERMGNPPEMHQKLERMAEELNLTDEQKEQLKHVYRQSRSRLQKLRDAMQDNREALRKLDPEDAHYHQQVARLARKQGALVEKMIKARSHVRAEIYAILTPEQREKARNLRKHHRHERPGRLHPPFGG
jgi:Spy/CpxP family protein refolding chaperone